VIVHTVVIHTYPLLADADFVALKGGQQVTKVPVEGGKCQLGYDRE